LVLDAAAGGGPRGEAAKFGAIFPGQVEEFFGGEGECFFAEVGFEAPLEVRAFPGLKAVTSGGDPVVGEKIEHGIGERSLTNEIDGTNRGAVRKCLWQNAGSHPGE